MLVEVQRSARACAEELRVWERDCRVMQPMSPTPFIHNPFCTMHGVDCACEELDCYCLIYHDLRDTSGGTWGAPGEANTGVFPIAVSVYV